MGKAHGKHQARARWGLYGMTLLGAVLVCAMLVAITRSVSNPPVASHLRPVATRPVTIPASSHSPVPRAVHHLPPASPPPAGRYTVKPGDTIWDIAAAQYTAAIEQANRALLARQHGVIYAGEVLRIPILHS